MSTRKRRFTFSMPFLGHGKSIKQKKKKDRTENVIKCQFFIKLNTIVILHITIAIIFQSASVILIVCFLGRKIANHEENNDTLILNYRIYIIVLIYVVQFQLTIHFLLEQAQFNIIYNRFIIYIYIHLIYIYFFNIFKIQLKLVNKERD